MPLCLCLCNSGLVWAHSRASSGPGRSVLMVASHRQEGPDGEVGEEGRGVGQRDPQQLGVPARTVAGARVPCAQSMLHAPSHLGEICTAQYVQEEPLGFQI